MSPTVRERLDHTLLAATDACLAGVVFVVPLLMGGRHAAGHFALTVLAFGAACAWLGRQSLRPQAAWHGGATTIIALLAMLIVALQTMPLPEGLLAWLSPQIHPLLPLWAADGNNPLGLGAWPCLSFTPAETQASFVILIDYCLVFFVTLHRVESVEDVQRLLRWCGLSIAAIGLFGLVQFLFSNGKFFWFYEHPFSSTRQVAVGPFSNRNHFAHFLALGIGPLLWWLAYFVSQQKQRKARQDFSIPLVGLALAIVLFAGLLSLSRGGMLAMLTAFAVFLAAGHRTLLLNRKTIAAIGGVVVLIAAALGLFGFEKVSQRWQQLTSGSLDQMDQAAGRRTIWSGAVKAIGESPVWGSGVGSFGSFYPIHGEAPRDDMTTPTHAENGYLQILAETGLVGFGILLSAIVFLAISCFRGLRNQQQPRLQACYAAIAASLAASLVHAAVDFVWYVPACVSLTLVLAACAWRGCHLAPSLPAAKRMSAVPNISQAGLPASRVAWVASLAILLCIGTWMLTNRFGAAVAQTYWDDYLVERHELDAQATADTNPLLDVDLLERWMGELNEAVTWQPSHFQAHLALAELHRYCFEAAQAKAENTMTLSDLRDAAEQAKFDSPEKCLAWLSRASGGHVIHLQQSLAHAAQSLRLCPLQGRAYIYAAELAFVDGGDAAWRRACIDQAMLVRPSDGEVLYAAAGQALLAGDTERWLDYLKRAFRLSVGQQQRILTSIVAATPDANLPTVVDFLIRELQPDYAAIWALNKACAPRSPESMPAIYAHWAKCAETEAERVSGVDAARYWVTAAQMHHKLGVAAETSRCLDRAIEADPDSYDAHNEMAREKFDASDFAAAEEHLRWCLQRRPNDEAVAKRLLQTLKGRLDSQRQASTPKEPLR